MRLKCSSDILNLKWNAKNNDYLSYYWVIFTVFNMNEIIREEKCNDIKDTIALVNFYLSNPNSNRLTIIWHSI